MSDQDSHLPFAGSAPLPSGTAGPSVQDDTPPNPGSPHVHGSITPNASQGFLNVPHLARQEELMQTLLAQSQQTNVMMRFFLQQFGPAAFPNSALPAPLPSQAPTSVPMVPSFESPDVGVSTSRVANPTAGYTFEAFGGPTNIFLSTPTSRVPLQRRTSQLAPMPLVWETEEEVSVSNPNPGNPSLDSSPGLPQPAVNAASASASLPHPTHNQFNNLVSGLNDGSRRLSQTARAVRGSTDLSTLTPTQVVLHPPSHNIELSGLSVNAIIRFVTEVIDYQYRYRIPLQVPSLIRPAIVRELMARHPRLNYAVFQSLEADQVFHLLQFELTPSTSFEVINRLERSARFKLDDSKYRPSSRDYRPFYSAILTFIREFTLAYDLITGLLPSDLIPRLTTKDSGILKVFLNKIPFEYGWRLHNTYLQDQIVSKNQVNSSLSSNTQAIHNFHRYLSAFAQYVNQHFQVYRDCRTFEQFFGGTSFHGGNNSSRPRHGLKSHKLSAVSPLSDTGNLDELSSDSSASRDNDYEDDSPVPSISDGLLPNDMDYPEVEDTLDNGNMYADTPQTSFVPSAADPGLSLAEARSIEGEYVLPYDDDLDIQPLNAISSQTPYRPLPTKDSNSDKPKFPFQGNSTPRPPHAPQRTSPSNAGYRTSSPSASAHASVHSHGHRLSSNRRYPTATRRPPPPPSASTPAHPNTPPWQRSPTPGARAS